MKRYRVGWVLALLLTGGIACDRGDPAPPLAPEWNALNATLLVPRGSTWRYRDDGVDLGAGWRTVAFDDAGWRSGPAQLGYGDGDEATVVGYGPSPDNRHVTTYFRRSFTVTDPARYAALTIRLLRDDGAVAYLNDVEVFRTNMPGGTIGAGTTASTAIPWVDESRFFEAAVDARLLRTGTNVLAVEVHQATRTSSDVSFDAELDGTQGDAPPTGPRPRVASYLVNYGPWTSETIAVAKRHRLVVAHPRYGNLTRELVSDLRRGADPVDPSDDVAVVCYASVGEDLRSVYVTDQQARGDPRFAGDRTGPRVDPRGPDADGRSLSGIDPRGAASPGGSGYASFYLDDNSVDRNGVGDGVPDRNSVFGGYFVNAGDPAWFDVADRMTLDGPDGIAGFREILTTTTGRGLGCDGVFLDTVDTAAPNHYTNRNSYNQSEFEWTSPGLSAFVRRLRAAHPGHLIVQNRGLFYLDPRHPQYQFTTRGSVDFVLFESYRLNSSSEEEWNPYFYPDNRFNLAPKLLAEAGRADGFQILSLGYESLLEDIRVTEELVGFRHYLTDWRVALVNSFVLDHLPGADWTAPVWTSTYNDRQPGWPTPPGEPTPRVGVQEVIAGPRQVTIRWDVALDRSGVGYAVYVQTNPFDPQGDQGLTRAMRHERLPEAPPNYPGWGGPGIVANQTTLRDLEPGVRVFVIVRAFDRSAARNEEKNWVVGTGVPTP